MRRLLGSWLRIQAYALLAMADAIDPTEWLVERQRAMAQHPAGKGAAPSLRLVRHDTV